MVGTLKTSEKIRYKRPTPQISIETNGGLLEFMYQSIIHLI